MNGEAAMASTTATIVPTTTAAIAPAPAATLDARGAAPIARSTARSSGSERSCRLSASPTSTRHAKNAMAPNSVSAMDSGRTACCVWKVVTDVTRKNCGLPGSRRLT